MTLEDWPKIRHFTESEFDDPLIIEKDLVFELDNFRHYLGSSVIITSSTRGEHSRYSQHPLGRAVDIMFPGTPRHKLPDIFLFAMRFKFTGIGVYSYWQLDGQILGGLHLDCRESFQRVMWLSVKPKEYLPLTFKDLTTYF